MDFSELVRLRSSVRHFDTYPVSDALVQRILDEARWAPSAGNLQPWSVIALSHRASREFIGRFEMEGWESVLPSLRVAIEAHMQEQGLSSREINERALEAFAREVRVTGNPRVLLIYYPKRSWTEIVHLAKSAASLGWFRAQGKGGLGARIHHLVSIALRGWRDLRVADTTVTASLANFAYGICLSATNLGLGSCIQFSYNHVAPSVATFLHVPDHTRIFGVVLIGYTDDVGGAKVVNSRSRRPVELTFIP